MQFTPPRTIQELHNFAQFFQRQREASYGLWKGTCRDCTFWRDLDGTGPFCTDWVFWPDGEPENPYCLVPRAANDDDFNDLPPLRCA